VKLVWHAPSASYKAMFGANVELALSPVVVSIRGAGNAFFAAWLPWAAADVSATGNLAGLRS
jgi:hypothetical protein